MSGYIRLHRKLINSYQFSNPEILKIWVWMLFKASWKDQIISIKVNSGYCDIQLERGQFIFGRSAAAKELGLSESNIYRMVQKLHLGGSIEVKSNNKYSIITICKYDEYNNEENESEQPVNSQRTASEQPVNTYKKDKKVNKVNNNGNKLPLTDKEIAFVSLINKITGKNFKTLDQKTKKQFEEILSNGYDGKQIKFAITTALSEMSARDKQNYLTPEFITRPQEFQKYVNMMPIQKKQENLAVSVSINHDNR